MTRYLNVNELFGPTIQGEGRHAGRLASFIRLAGCNLSCSWCDTPYTWDWDRYDRAAEVHRMTIHDAADALDQLPGRVVVSGGEPLLQDRALAELMAALPDRSWDVETNGTVPPRATAGRWSTITCSPKIIPSAGDHPAPSQVHPAHLEVSDFKFVVHDDADLGAVDRWLEEHQQVTPDRVWLMPEGTTPDELTNKAPWLMDAATHRGVNYTTRLHVYGWGDTRGT